MSKSHIAVEEIKYLKSSKDGESKITGSAGTDANYRQIHDCKVSVPSDIFVDKEFDLKDSKHADEFKSLDNNK
jgi:hypothetical protein